MQSRIKTQEQDIKDLKKSMAELGETVIGILNGNQKESTPLLAIG